MEPDSVRFPVLLLRAVTGCIFLPRHNRGSALPPRQPRGALGQQPSLVLCSVATVRLASSPRVSGLPGASLPPELTLRLALGKPALYSAPPVTSFL